MPKTPHEPWPWENVSPEELPRWVRGKPNTYDSPADAKPTDTPARPKTYDVPAKPRDPIVLNTHRDLRGNIRNICQRLNDTPDLARMLLVNPILALEDAGVEMTAEVKQHIMNALRFPPSLQNRRTELEIELDREFKARRLPFKLPLTDEQRAHLLFDVLKLEPQPYSGRERLTSKQARAHSRKHPLVAKLAEYERARQGRMIFYPREIYETYKAGLKRHHWIKSVKFNV